MEAVSFLHNTAKIVHTAIDADSILLSKNGKIKLGLGDVLNDDDSESTTLMSEKLSLYEACSINSPSFYKRFSFNSDSDNSAMQAKDVFDLGIVLLVSAVGGLELFNQEVLDIKSPDKGCCILHNIMRTEKQDQTCIIGLQQFLGEDKFSPHFEDFLCKCLKFDHTERSRISDLLAHPWFDSQERVNSGPILTLQELLDISEDF